jgi:tRNA G18 (ribose-2'-O)-methylase SpoU
MLKLGAADLRDYKPTPEELSNIKRKQIYIICDNILDTYNIGAIFRLADASAVSGVYLVGATGTPTDPLTGHKVHKASVGVWQWVPWKHVETVSDAVEDIKKDIEKQSKKDAKLTVVAVEQSEKSIPYTKANYNMPIALILGHETEGVSAEGLSLANQIVEIPMYGVNKSMNVMVSLAIVLWEVLGQKIV